MVLARQLHERERLPGRLQLARHRFGLRDRHDRVVDAVQQQDRRADVLRQPGRRPLGHLRVVHRADVLGPVGERVRVLATHHLRVTEHRREVRDTVDADGARVEVRRQRRARQRREAAVARADDADAPWIHQAARDQRLHAVGDVVLHQAAPLAIAGEPVRLAVAGRAAELRLQHDVAARREELHEPVELVGIVGLGPAVRQHDQRQVLLAGARRQRQERGNRRTVARRVRPRLDSPECHVGERRVRLADDVGGPLRQVDEVVDGRVRRARDVGEHALRVARAAADLDLPARERARDPAVQRFGLRIEPDDPPLGPADRRADGAAVVGVADHPVHVVRRILRDDRLPRTVERDRPQLREPARLRVVRAADREYRAAVRRQSDEVERDAVPPLQERLPRAVAAAEQRVERLVVLPLGAGDRLAARVHEPLARERRAGVERAPLPGPQVDREQLVYPARLALALADPRVDHVVGARDRVVERRHDHRLRRRGAARDHRRTRREAPVVVHQQQARLAALQVDGDRPEHLVPVRLAASPLHLVRDADVDQQRLVVGPAQPAQLPVDADRERAARRAGRRIERDDRDALRPQVLRPRQRRAVGTQYDTIDLRQRAEGRGGRRCGAGVRRCEQRASDDGQQRPRDDRAPHADDPERRPTPPGRVARGRRLRHVPRSDPRIGTARGVVSVHASRSRSSTPGAKITRPPRAAHRR